MDKQKQQLKKRAGHIVLILPPLNCHMTMTDLLLPGPEVFLPQSEGKKIICEDQ